MPRTASRLLALLPTAALLSACVMTPTQNVWTLNLQPTGNGTPLRADRLLLDQRVPVAQLVSVRKALDLAPDGSLILACSRTTTFSNFYGPCSHIARKIDGGHLAETFLTGRAGTFPLSRLYDRYAVIVLDAGAREEHLPVMRAEVERLRGRPYDLSNAPDTYYCSNYQNQLQRVAGLPDAVPWNDTWKMYVPADVLLNPDVRVLWVGVNEEARSSVPPLG